MARNAAMMSAPEAYTGAFGFTWPAWTATIGAQRPVILFKQDAIPVPVPRLGAGKTSGVYAYSTPYMISVRKLALCGVSNRSQTNFGRMLQGC
jgi:hypothetical protein